MKALFIILAVAIASTFAGHHQQQQQQEPCLDPVNCFVDPCQVSKGCPNYPDAECRANYCGGCNDYYYVDGEKVDCHGPMKEDSATLNIMNRGRANVRNSEFPIHYDCPALDPGAIGTCANECETDDDCNGGPLFETHGNKKCCSNGCGHVCKTGVLPQSKKINWKKKIL